MFGDRRMAATAVDHFSHLARRIEMLLETRHTGTRLQLAWRRLSRCWRSSDGWEGEFRDWCLSPWPRPSPKAPRKRLPLPSHSPSPLSPLRLPVPLLECSTQAKTRKAKSFPTDLAGNSIFALREKRRSRRRSGRPSIWEVFKQLLQLYKASMELPRSKMRRSKRSSLVSARWTRTDRGPAEGSGAALKIG